MAVGPYKRVMVFIDGGYLREGCRKLVGHEDIDFDGLILWLVGASTGMLSTEFGVTRIYYYDAIVEASDDLNKHKEQKEFFHKIGLCGDYEVKLGRMVKTGSGEYRQKGVDILIAVDMLAKAFLDFYDVAVFLGGDDDFVDLVNTVKNLTNKKVCGAAFENNVSPRLLESFDRSYNIDVEIRNRYRR